MSGTILICLTKMVKAKEVIKAVLKAPVRVIAVPVGIVICIPHFVIGVVTKGLGILGSRMIKWALGYQPDMIDDKEMEEKIGEMITKFKARRNERAKVSKP